VAMDDPAEVVLRRLLDGLIREDVMEMHWLVRSGEMNLLELHDIEPLPNELYDGTYMEGGGNGKNSYGLGVKKGSAGVAGGRNGGALSKKPGYASQSSIHGAQAAQCPVCRQFVSGSRFAPHLERCIMGKKRAGRTHYSSLEDGLKRQARVPFVDPHPDSAIIRIKVRRDNGVPLAIKQNREGVSKEEWDKVGNEEN
jgi:hypothetical protein